MFLGEYKLSFTGKGRLVLPKGLREELAGNDIILSRGFEGCIWGFSRQAWEEEIRKQLEIPITEERGRSLRRYLFSASEKAQLDNQGRFVISPELLRFGRLVSEVVIIGAGEHFEIWNKLDWQRTLKKVEEAYGR